MKFFDRVKMRTATTGTGNLALGTAPLGFRTLEQAGAADGDQVPYVIQEGASFARGIGTWTQSTNTLVRDANEIRWTGGVESVAKLSLAGTAMVFVGLHAEVLESLAADVAAAAESALDAAASEGVATTKANEASDSATAAATSAADAAAQTSFGIASADPTNSGYDSLTVKSRNLFSYSRATSGTARAIISIPNRAAGSKITILYIKRGATGGLPTVRLRNTSGTFLAAVALAANTDDSLNYVTLTVDTGSTANAIAFGTSSAASGEIFYIAFDGEGEFLTSSGGRLPTGIERLYWEVYKEQVAREALTTTVSTLDARVTSEAAAIYLGITSADPTNSAYDTLTVTGRNLLTYAKAAASTGQAVFAIGNRAEGSKITVLYRVIASTGSVPYVRLRATDSSLLAATSLNVDGEWHTVTLSVDAGKTANQIRFGTTSTATGTIFFIAYDGEGEFLTATNGRLATAAEVLAWEIYRLATAAIDLEARVATVEATPSRPDGSLPVRIPLLDRDSIPSAADESDGVIQYMLEDRSRKLLVSDGVDWSEFDGTPVSEVSSVLPAILDAAGGVSGVYLREHDTTQVAVGMSFGNGQAAEVYFRLDPDGLLLVRGGYVGAQLAGSNIGVLDTSADTMLLAVSTIIDFAVTARATGSGVTSDWVPSHSSSTGCARNVVRDIRVNGVSIGNDILAISGTQPISSFEVIQAFDAYSSYDVAGTYKLWEHRAVHRWDRYGLKIDNRLNVLLPLDATGYPGPMLASDDRYVDTLYLFDTGASFPIAPVGSDTSTTIDPEERVAAYFHSTEGRIVALATHSLGESLPASPVAGDQFFTQRTANHVSKKYDRRFNGSVVPGIYRSSARLVLASGFDPALVTT